MRSLSTLSRHKPTLLLIGVLALAAAISTSYRLNTSPLGLKSRAVPVGAATAQVLIDSPQSALGNLRQNTEPLTTRAGVFAQFMASNGVRMEIAARTGIPASQITARGPFDDPAAAPNGAAAPDPATGAVGSKPYSLTFAAQDSLPLVTVYAQAPDAHRAGVLADGAVAGVQSYVAKLQAEGRLPAWQRVVVRRLGAADAGTVAGKAKVPLMVVAFLAVFGFGCFIVLLVASARARRRAAVAAPAVTADGPLPPVVRADVLAVGLPDMPDGRLAEADSPIRVA
jgi:hypothetical protein